MAQGQKGLGSGYSINPNISISLEAAQSLKGSAPEKTIRSIRIITQTVKAELQKIGIQAMAALQQHPSAQRRQQKYESTGTGANPALFLYQGKIFLQLSNRPGGIRIEFAAAGPIQASLFISRKPVLQDLDILPLTFLFNYPGRKNNFVSRVLTTAMSQAVVGLIIYYTPLVQLEILLKAPYRRPGIEAEDAVNLQGFADNMLRQQVQKRLQDYHIQPLLVGNLQSQNPAGKKLPRSIHTPTPPNRKQGDGSFVFWHTSKQKNRPLVFCCFLV